MQDIILERFRRFKEILVSSNVPNNILLELLESYIKTDAKNMVAREVPILDGQLSLFDLAG